MSLEGIDVAKKIVEAAADKQASNIVLLDARKSCSFADYFVICNGESDRQTDAIRHSIVEALKEASLTVFHCEGNADSGWILLDVGDVIVHIFAPFEREYYQMDQLWENAPIVVKML